MNSDVRTASTWVKSSYSTGTGNCIEVSWRKSSYSTATGNCVEFASAGDDVVLRDSKRPAAGTITVSRPAWNGLLGRARG